MVIFKGAVGFPFFTDLSGSSDSIEIDETSVLLSVTATQPEENIVIANIMEYLVINLDFLPRFFSIDDSDVFLVFVVVLIIGPPVSFFYNTDLLKRI